MSKPRVGRKVGSKVKLTSWARKIYPQFVGKVGVVRGKEILTKGHGLMRSAYRNVPYKLNYWVRFEGEKRDYFLGADCLTSA